MGIATNSSKQSFFFDDFEIGMKFSTATIRITEDEIIEFAEKYDPQPFHVDPVAARQGHYGSLISSGFMTVAKSFTQFLQLGLIKESSMGGWGIDELRWYKPVVPNDDLDSQIEVVDKRISSKGFQRGTVRFKIKVSNQNNEKVLEFISNTLIIQKPHI